MLAGRPPFHHDMNNLFAIWGAAVLAAPVFGQSDAATLLQRAVGIEQHEGDLGTAEREYRKVLASADGTVRQEAALRLGSLLWRLDRKPDATALLEQAQAAGGDLGARATAVLTGQDPAGKQAEELAVKVRDTVDRALRGEQGVDDQLTWLGAAAVVPELGRRVLEQRAASIDYLQQLWAKRDAIKARSAVELVRTVQYGGRGPNPLATHLVHAGGKLLWQIGGAEAAAWLREQLRDPAPEWRRLLACASEERAHASLLPVVEAMLADQDPDGAVPVLAMRAALQLPIEVFGRQLQAARADVREAAWSVLQQHAAWRDSWQGSDELEAALTVVLPAVEQALASEDPVRSRAAFQFLRGPGCASPRGSALFLQWLPKVPAFERGGVHQGIKATLADLVACAKVLGPSNAADGRDDRRIVVAENAFAAFRGDDQAALLLDLVALGYDVVAQKPIAGAALQSEPTAADLVRLCACLGSCHDSAAVAQRLADVELPAAAAEPLLRRLEVLLAAVPPYVDAARRPQAQQAAAGELYSVFAALGRTGNPAAIAPLLALANQRPDWRHAAVAAVLGIAARSAEGTAGAALRELLVDAKGSPEQRNLAFGALVASGDAAAIPLFAEAYRLGLAESSAVASESAGPTRERGSKYRGVGWLRAPGHDRFDPAQRLAIWQSLLQSDGWCEVLLDAGGDEPTEVTIAMLEAMAARTPALAAAHREQNGGWWEPPYWVKPLLAQVAKTVPVDAAEPSRRFRAAFAAVCADERLGGLAMEELQDPAAIRLLADQLMPLLRGPNAFAAYRALQFYGGVAVPPTEVVAGLQHAGHRVEQFLELLPRDAAPEVVRHVETLLDDPGVVERIAACHTLGRFLSASSAPALLSALRDRSSDVRAAATAALQQIRLFHEQKAFWDQFQTGIATSREAAAAKLLAQGKPDQPQDQRLLALAALGALGAAEALPYLIDWTKDPDAEVAAAARAAIARIQAATTAK